MNRKARPTDLTDEELELLAPFIPLLAVGIGLYLPMTDLPGVVRASVRVDNS